MVMCPFVFYLLKYLTLTEHCTYMQLTIISAWKGSFIKIPEKQQSSTWLYIMIINIMNMYKSGFEFLRANTKCPNVCFVSAEVDSTCTIGIGISYYKYFVAPSESEYATLGDAVNWIHCSIISLVTNTCTTAIKDEIGLQYSYMYVIYKGLLVRSRSYMYLGWAL